MGKYHSLSWGVNKKINSMISLGMKKQDMIIKIQQDYLSSGHSAEDWEKNKCQLISQNSYLRSCGSIDKMRQASVPFLKWAAENNIKKFELCSHQNMLDYLQFRKSQNLSSWSLSSDIWFLNKCFGENITKAEAGIKSRLQKDVTHSRSGGIPKNRPHLAERYKDQITFVRATGARRASISTVTPSCFIRNSNNEIIQVYLREKGGKERLAYVQPEYREELSRICESKAPQERLFPEGYNKHISYHYFRGEYCKTLLAALTRQGHNHELWQLNPSITISKYDYDRYHETGWKGFDLENIIQCSKQMGHNRADFIKSYLY